MVGGELMFKKSTFSPKIKSFSYLPKLELLEIEYDNSTVSQYTGVPKEDYEGLKHTHSKEKFYEKFIKYEYPHQVVGKSE